MKSRIASSRACAAMTYAPGTIRAWRWHGNADVRSYRPPPGWSAIAEMTDMHPISGRRLPQSVWWIVETKL